MTTKDLEAARWRYAAAIFIWRKSVMAEGKDEFYPKVYEALTKAGFHVFSGKEIPGKGRSHASKSDYIAVKGNMVVIGEIKAPGEPPTSSSWRQIQNSDGDNFKKVRLDVARREAAGELPKEIGGHEIIICGQIPDYFEKLGKTYDLPSGTKTYGKIVAGYSFPVAEMKNFSKAFLNCKVTGSKVVQGTNGVASIFYK